MQEAEALRECDPGRGFPATGTPYDVDPLPHTGKHEPRPEVGAQQTL
jgi:hypothetical protein